MKHLLAVIIAIFIALPSFAQVTTGAGYYTMYSADKALNKKANWWLHYRQNWRGPFLKAKAHESVNATEFYKQYEKNPKQWKALFKWLQYNDLLTIEPGKYKLEDAGITISVEDTHNEALENRQSESHHHTVDFQYVVKGTERFGLIDHYTSTPNCPYRKDVIHYDYNLKKTKFYDSKPNEFFIFFPQDWHIAKVNNDTEDQEIRVIVAKLDYVE